MPFTIVQMPKEPIIIAKIEVPLDKNLASISSINTQLDQIISASSDHIYILIDVRDQTPCFSDILIAIDLLNHPDSWVEQRCAHPILVGSDPMNNVAVKRFKQQLDVDLFIFDTLEEALAHARTEIARSNPPDKE